MCLLIEIALAIVAWRRGWKAWVLLPFGIVFFSGFTVGLAIGATGGTPDPDVVNGIGLLLDLVLIVVLGVMALVAPKNLRVQPSQPLQSAEAETQKFSEL